MKKTFIITLTLLACLFSGCDEETTEAPVLVIDIAQLEAVKAVFPVEGDSRTATIRTNLNSVKVSSTQPWCKAQILDEDGYSLLISVMPNEGFENRSAMVVVYGKGVEDVVIPVTQFCSTPFLKVDKEEITIINGDLTFSLTISSNLDYVLRRNEWIDDDGDNAVVVGTKTYNYKVASIAPETSREGRIDIQVTDLLNESYNKSIPVRQSQDKLSQVITSFSPSSGVREDVITLRGENFGTNSDLIGVYFNDAAAEIVSVADNAINVLVPKVTGDADAVETTIKICVDEEAYIYDAKFTYNKSWYLSTLTGNGEPTFKGGTLAEGQIQARYLCVDANENIFASHREKKDNRYVVKINEAENSVMPLGGPYNPSEYVNNAPIVLPDGKILVANDIGTTQKRYSYYIYDPEKLWEPERVEFTYDSSPGEIYVYKYSYNQTDHCLYGFTSTDMHIVNMETKKAVKYASFAGSPIWPYAHVFDADCKKIYTAFGTEGKDYYHGPYEFDPAAFIEKNVVATRMNYNYNKVGEAPATDVVDGLLSDSGFGACWGMDWGPDGKLYLADFANNVIRAIDLKAEPITVETVLGVPGKGKTVNGPTAKARLNGPRGIAWNKTGTALYISDFTGCTIRKWAFE